MINNIEHWFIGDNCRQYYNTLPGGSIESRQYSKEEVDSVKTENMTNAELSTALKAKYPASGKFDIARFDDNGQAMTFKTEDDAKNWEQNHKARDEWFDKIWPLLENTFKYSKTGKLLLAIVKYDGDKSSFEYDNGALAATNMDLVKQLDADGIYDEFAESADSHTDEFAKFCELLRVQYDDRHIAGEFKDDRSMNTLHQICGFDAVQEQKQ